MFLVKINIDFVALMSEKISIPQNLKDEPCVRMQKLFVCLSLYFSLAANLTKYENWNMMTTDQIDFDKVSETPKF